MDGMGMSWQLNREWFKSKDVAAFERLLQLAAKLKSKRVLCA